MINMCKKEDGKEIMKTDGGNSENWGKFGVRLEKKLKSLLQKGGTLTSSLEGVINTILVLKKSILFDTRRVQLHMEMTIRFFF